jgi:hypothetical protein
MRAVRTVKLKRHQDAAFTDFSDWVDRAGYEPPAADLKGIITTAQVRLVDPDRTIPFEPAAGVLVQLEDVTPAVVFGGWIAAPVIDVPGVRVPAWTFTAQGWGARFAESATGSLNKSGILDTDRNFVIAMIVDALGAAAQQFASDNAGADDSIVAANAAVGWSGVQGTAFLYGTDWSYRPLLDVLQDLIDRVPGVSLRIRPDKIVEFGVFATPAPVVLASVLDAVVMSAANVVEIDAASYTEEVLAAGHFNKVRLGGIGAAEDTAYDQTSMGKFGRVMAAPYVNDENLAAADVTRAAYAKLASLATRRIAKAITTNDQDALEPGMLVPILVSDLGCYEDEGWSVDPSEVYLGTPLMEPAAGYRGELLVQKVTPTFVAPGVQRYVIELGAYVPSFENAIAERIGG